MVYKFQKYLAFSFTVKILFLEALFTQYMVWFILKLLPFRKTPQIFANPRAAVKDPDKNLIEQIRLATGYAGRLAFWKNRCLVQSLAVRLMLHRRRIPSRLSLGIMHDKNNMLVAHAWIEACGLEIVERIGNFTEMQVF